MDMDKTATKEDIRAWVERTASYAIPNTFIPEQIDHVAMCVEHIHRWYWDNYPLGSFLRAVVRNDLIETFMLADDVNRKAMFLFCIFLYNELPSDWRLKGKA